MRRRVRAAGAVTLCLLCPGCANLNDDAGWPEITVLPILVAPAAGDFAGDVSLLAPGAVAGKPFLEMGATVPSPDGPKQIPNFEFYVRATAVVVAPVSGVVWAVGYHAQFDDYGILIRRGFHTELWVEIDHVSNPTVRAGDEVTAGQPIGTAGKTNDPATGRVELQVSDGRRRPVTHYCPNVGFAPTATADIEGKLIRLMQDVEARAGNAALYNEGSMFRVGCNMEMLVER
jgi:hypothetical protein